MRLAKRLHRQIKADHRIGASLGKRWQVKRGDPVRHHIGDVEHRPAKLDRWGKTRQRHLRQRHRQVHPLQPDLARRLHIKHIRAHRPGNRQDRLANTGRRHQRLKTTSPLDVQLSKHRHTRRKRHRATRWIRLRQIIQNLRDVAGNARRDRLITRR